MSKIVLMINNQIFSLEKNRIVFIQDPQLSDTDGKTCLYLHTDPESKALMNVWIPAPKVEQDIALSEVAKEMGVSVDELTRLSHPDKDIAYIIRKQEYEHIIGRFYFQQIVPLDWVLFSGATREDGAIGMILSEEICYYRHLSSLRSFRESTASLNLASVPHTWFKNEIAPHTSYQKVALMGLDYSSMPKTQLDSIIVLKEEDILKIVENSPFKIKDRFSINFKAKRAKPYLWALSVILIGLFIYMGVDKTTAYTKNQFAKAKLERITKENKKVLDSIKKHENMNVLASYKPIPDNIFAGVIKRVEQFPSTSRYILDTNIKQGQIEMSLELDLSNNEEVIKAIQMGHSATVRPNGAHKVNIKYSIKDNH